MADLMPTGWNDGVEYYSIDSGEGNQIEGLLQRAPELAKNIGLTDTSHIDQFALHRDASGAIDKVNIFGRSDDGSGQFTLTVSKDSSSLGVTCNGHMIPFKAGGMIPIVNTPTSFDSLPVCQNTPDKDRPIQQTNVQSSIFNDLGSLLEKMAKK